jgi:hypothetical protein
MSGLHRNEMPSIAERGTPKAGRASIVMPTQVGIHVFLLVRWQSGPAKRRSDRGRRGSRAPVAEARSLGAAVVSVPRTCSARSTSPGTFRSCGPPIRRDPRQVSTNLPPPQSIAIGVPST